MAAALPVDHSAAKMRHARISKTAQLPRCNFAHTTTPAIKDNLCALVRRQLVDTFSDLVEVNLSISVRDLALVGMWTFTKKKSLFGSIAASCALLIVVKPPSSPADCVPVGWDTTADGGSVQRPSMSASIKPMVRAAAAEVIPCKLSSPPLGLGQTSRGVAPLRGTPSAI